MFCYKYMQVQHELKPKFSTEILFKLVASLVRQVM